MSAKDIAAFEKDGYIIFERAIGPRHIRALLRELSRATATAAATTAYTTVPAADRCSYSFEKTASGELRQPVRLHKAQGIGLESAGVRELISNPRLASTALALSKRTAAVAELDAFGTKFFPVGPGSPGSVGWHDDNFYFGTTRSHTVSAVLYLREMSVNVGCLRVVPGSHLDKAVGPDHERAKHYQKGVFRDGEFISEETIVSGALSVDRHGARRRPIDVIVPAGSAVLFDANLLHAVHPNRSDGPSERVAFHYIPGDLGAVGFRGTSFARGDFADRHLACVAGEGLGGAKSGKAKRQRTS